MIHMLCDDIRLHLCLIPVVSIVARFTSSCLFIADTTARTGTFEGFCILGRRQQSAETASHVNLLSYFQLKVRLHSCFLKSWHTRNAMMGSSIQSLGNVTTGWPTSESSPFTLSSLNSYPGYLTDFSEFGCRTSFRVPAVMVPQCARSALSCLGRIFDMRAFRIETGCIIAELKFLPLFAPYLSLLARSLISLLVSGHVGSRYLFSNHLLSTSSLLLYHDMTTPPNHDLYACSAMTSTTDYQVSSEVFPCIPLQFRLSMVVLELTCLWFRTWETRASDDRPSKNRKRGEGGSEGQVEYHCILWQSKRRRR